MSDEIEDRAMVWFSEQGVGQPVWISTFQGPGVYVSKSKSNGIAVWHSRAGQGEHIWIRNPKELPDFVKRHLDRDGRTKFY